MRIAGMQKLAMANSIGHCIPVSNDVYFLPWAIHVRVDWPGTDKPTIKTHLEPSLGQTKHVELHTQIVVTKDQHCPPE